MPIGTSDGQQFTSEFEYLMSLVGVTPEQVSRWQDFRKSDNIEDRRDVPPDAGVSPPVELNETEDYPLDSLSEAAGLGTLDKQLNDPINSLLRKLEGFEETPPPEIETETPVS